MPIIVEIFAESVDKTVYPVLVERWKIHHVTEEKTDKVFVSSLIRRMGIVRRTLYCFIRLLPAIHLHQLPAFSDEPIMRCKISVVNQNAPYENSFYDESEIHYYTFPIVPTRSGSIRMELQYLSESGLKVFLIHVISLTIHRLIFAIFHIRFFCQNLCPSPNYGYPYPRRNQLENGKSTQTESTTS